MTKIIPPKRIAVGWKEVTGEKNICVIESIKISSKAKTAIKIQNEDRFDRIRDEKLGKVMLTNKARTGFRFEETYEETRHSSSNKRSFTLYHPDFKGRIPLSFENLESLLRENITIENGEIKEPLIFTNKKIGFVTQDYIDKLNEEFSHEQNSLKKLKEELNPLMVNKEDLVPGKYYFYLNRNGRKVQVLFIGRTNERVFFREMFEAVKYKPEFEDLVNYRGAVNIQSWMNIKNNPEIIQHSPDGPKKVPYLYSWYRSLKLSPIFYRLEDEEEAEVNHFSHLSEKELKCLQIAVENMEK
jgi:hypothetical protein